MILMVIKIYYFLCSPDLFLQNTTYSLFQLVDDPIFIPIEQLEQKDGKPEEFSSVVQDIKAGKTGHLRIEKGRKAVHKVI